MLEICSDVQIHMNLGSSWEVQFSPTGMEILHLGSLWTSAVLHPYILYASRISLSEFLRGA